MLVIFYESFGEMLEDGVDVLFEIELGGLIDVDGDCDGLLGD
jgi:hypothetical protein